MSSVFGDEAFGVSEGATRLRIIILDVARDLFIRDSDRVFGAAPFAHQFTLSQARWPGEGGCRPISLLEGTALATAIGCDISLLQSGSEQQPQQAVIFRPHVVSMALGQRLEALRDHGRRNDSWVLIERPRQGCTVVVTEPAQSPVDAANGEAVGNPAVGAPHEGENVIFAGRATPPLTSPDSPSGGSDVDDWQCPICYESRPLHARIRSPCCGNLICEECTRQIVQRELDAVREDIRRSFRRPNGAQQRRRRLPFICPMCRHRSAISRNAPGEALRLILGNPTPQSPAIIAAASRPCTCPCPAPTRSSSRPILAALLRGLQLRCPTPCDARLGPRGRPRGSRSPLCSTPHGSDPQPSHRRSAPLPALGRGGTAGP